MAKKSRPSEHRLHATIITFSVIAGLALAACQPKMTTTPTPSPTPSPAVLGTQGSLNTEVDKALTEMDSSMKSADPNEVSGSDLQ
jgi:hypothetical protein